MLDRLDSHTPVAGMGQRMEITIIHERVQFPFEGAASPDQCVLKESSVFALLHPNAFFHKGISKSVGPHGSRTFQVKVLEEQKTFGFNGAAGPAMSGKRKIRAGIV